MELLFLLIYSYFSCCLALIYFLIPLIYSYSHLVRFYFYFFNILTFLMIFTYVTVVFVVYWVFPLFQVFYYKQQQKRHNIILYSHSLYTSKYSIHICISVDCCWSVFLLLAKMLLETEKNLLLLDCWIVRSFVLLLRV